MKGFVDLPRDYVLDFRTKDTLFGIIICHSESGENSRFIAIQACMFYVGFSIWKWQD